MKKFYKNLLHISLPIMVQGLITSSINLFDVFMIGRLGEVPIASVGLANQVMLLLMLALFGINGAGVIFIAQYYGRDDTKSIKKMISLCSFLVVIVTTLFTALAFLMPRSILTLYTDDADVIKLGATYLKVVAISYIFSGISITTGQLLSGMSKTKEAMFASIGALVVNVCLNYLLIFGKYGFPELGVLGAAIATTIARFIESIIILSLAYIKKYPIFFSTKYFRKINISLIKSYIETGLPVLGSYMLWAIGTTTLVAIYARIGTDAVVAINIFGSIEKIAYTGIIALGCASGIVIGQELGKNSIAKATQYAKKLNIIGFLIAIVTSLLLVLLKDVIVGLYNITPEVINLTKSILKLFCLILPFSTINNINMIGTLRAGGETKLILIFDIICMWCTTVPMAYLGFKLGLPIVIVYLMAIGSGEAVKLLLSMTRVVSLKWAKSIS